MEVRRRKEEGKRPKLTPLKDVAPGKTFGFRDDTLDEILHYEEGPGLWMKAKANGEKTGKVNIMDIKTGMMKETSDDHFVIVYPCQISVGDPEMESIKE